MISDVDINDWEQPKIELKAIKENEDGSADCTLTLNALGVKYLLNFAVIRILKDAVAEGKTHTPPEEHIE